jgi:hypothetical protein
MLKDVGRVLGAVGVRDGGAQLLLGLLIDELDDALDEALR